MFRRWLLAAAWIVTFGGGSTSAHENEQTTCDSEWTVFATGLNNPRHMRVGPDGMLYVAEAGLGGSQLATCEPADNLFTAFGPYMGGLSGRVSRIRPDGSVETVAEGFASFIDGTLEVLGTSDVAWIDKTLYVLTEGGGCTRGLPDHPAGVVRVGQGGSLTYVADITAFIRSNPVEEAPPLWTGGRLRARRCPPLDGRRGPLLVCRRNESQQHPPREPAQWPYRAAARPIGNRPGPHPDHSKGLPRAHRHLRRLSDLGGVNAASPGASASRGSRGRPSGSRGRAFRRGLRRSAGSGPDRSRFLPLSW